MRLSSRTLLFALVAALALGAVVVTLTGSGSRGVVEVETPTRPDVARSRPVAVEETSEVLRPNQVARLEETDLSRTTVLWPLRVELSLAEADYLPKEDGMQPIGSGANAAIQGRILKAGDVGTRAEVRFVAGPNEGRVLQTDGGGRFGANNLFPGLSIVEVRGRGLLGSRREVRLRQGKELPLIVNYGSPGRMTGRVQDREGEPIAGATVHVDGQEVGTDAEGQFYVGAVAAGQVLVEISHPDYASYQELVWVATSHMEPKGRLNFTLEEGCQLEVAVTSDVGGPGPVELVLVPAQATRRPAQDQYRSYRYPYHQRNPIRVTPGRPETIGGLPEEVVQVFAFRPGAEPKLAVVNLRRGQPYRLRLQLSPAPTLRGRVLHRGEPVDGADVRLEPPNAVRSTLAYLEKGSFFLETAVLPRLPVARQETITDETGRFAFASWEDVSATRYLEARSADGLLVAGRLVRRGEYEVDLELTELTLGAGELRLELPGRWQGLPVEVLVDGTPLEPWILPPGEDLRVQDLIEGRYGMRVTWDGVPLAEEEVSVRGFTERRIDLLPECIEGQNQEAWRRAGRVWPLQ